MTLGRYRGRICASSSWSWKSSRCRRRQWSGSFRVVSRPMTKGGIHDDFALYLILAAHYFLHELLQCRHSSLCFCCLFIGSFSMKFLAFNNTVAQMCESKSADTLLLLLTTLVSEILCVSDQCEQNSGEENESRIRILQPCSHQDGKDFFNLYLHSFAHLTGSSQLW